MEIQNEPPKSQFLKFRKWIPGITLGLLTIFLMIFFKTQQGSLTTFIDQGKEEIVKFYTENLYPLIHETTITNEDVFNFALYRNLPVNKDRKRILQIDADESGKEYIEIIPANLMTETKNYEKFISLMDLSSSEIDSLNRLLDSYRYPIYSSVLFKDEKTLAVNPNIINLHRVLFADLTRFAQSVDKNKAQKIIPVNYVFTENPDIDALIHEVKNPGQSEFVFYSPDTVFNLECDFNKEELYSNIKMIEEKSPAIHNNLNRVAIDLQTLKEEHKRHRPNFNYVWDNKSVKIFPTEYWKNQFNLPELQNLNEDLGKLSMQMTTDIIEIAKVSAQLASVMALENMNEKTEHALAENMSFEFNVEQFTEQIEENAKAFENQDWEEFGKKMQTIGLMFAEKYADSLSGKEQVEFEQNMQELKEQLKEMSDEFKQKRKLNKPKRK